MSEYCPDCRGKEEALILSINRITFLESRLTQAEEKLKVAREALVELCRLKACKDKFGKTPDYVKDKISSCTLLS